MIKDDGTFEIEIPDDSAPGVFLPTTITVRGCLSPAAALRFAKIAETTSPTQSEEALQKAVAYRMGVPRTRAEGIVVRNTDFDK